MKKTRIGCVCGQVCLAVDGPAMVSVECLCTSCRTAAHRMEALPGAPAVLEPHCGTRFVLYRKDRIRFLQGGALLREFRLTPTSSTRRVVATCCNTPVFLEFEKGHWLSLYGQLWPAGTLPALQMRTMAADLPADVVLPDDVPNSRTQPFSFWMTLLGAWIAMGLRSPKIAVNGTLDG